MGNSDEEVPDFKSTAGDVQDDDRDGGECEEGDGYEC